MNEKRTKLKEFKKKFLTMSDISYILNTNYSAARNLLLSGKIKFTYNITTTGKKKYRLVHRTDLLQFIKKYYI